MKTVYVVSYYYPKSGCYIPSIAFSSFKSADSFVKKDGGKWASLAEYPSEKTCVLNKVTVLE